nr:ATP-binding protein [uncultured Brevundimonas sp.]
MSRVLDIEKPALRKTADAVEMRRVVKEDGREAVRAFEHPLTLIGTGLAVAILVVASILFTRSSGMVAGLWGAGGVAIAIWLRNSHSRKEDAAFLAVLTVSILVGEILAGNAPGYSVLFTFANVLEITLGVILSRRIAPGQNMSSVTMTGRFVFAAALIAPIPAGLFISGMIALTGQGEFLESFQIWWFGHAMGIAILGCFGLALTRASVARLMRPLRLVEFGVLMLAIGLVYTAIYDGRLTFSFVLLPLLMLAAARLGVIGAVSGLLIVAVLAVGSAMRGSGPLLSDAPVPDQVMAAQLLVLIGYAPMILLASLLEDRNRLAAHARIGQARAERSSEAKSRLLANVAHEIKSPVAGIIGIGELWKDGRLGEVTPQQAEMAEMLVRTARQVEALAHDLLDVARAEAGAIKVDARPTDVAGLLEDTRRAALLRPEAQGLTIDVEVEGDGLTVLADSQRLAQVIDNLMSNALKYGASGGRIILRAARAGDCVRIEVADFGPGLSLEKQAQLFEPFNRLGLERSSIEGHGVGLALAKRLVELQQGAIGVESALGQGAVFWVQMPKA